MVGNLNPKFDAMIKADYPGTVAEVYVMEWVAVKKGAPLARLDTREVQAASMAADAQALQAEAAANRAVRECERALNLQEAGLMTEQGVEDADTQKKAALAAFEAAKAQAAVAQARLDKAVVRSPLAGVVAMRNVSPGDHASDNPIFRVVDNSLFDLTVAVPSTQIHEVAVGQPLTFTTEVVPGRTFEGSISFINPAVDRASRTVGVIAEVPNPDGTLKADLFVKGRILTKNREGVLQVPRAALQNWDLLKNKAALFVVEGETARKKSIETGLVSGEFVEVVSGIEKGEMVVTRGAFMLEDGDTVTATPSSGEGA